MYNTSVGIVDRPKRGGTISHNAQYKDFVSELSEKLNHGQVLFFTGAGLSVGWRGLLGGSVASMMVEDLLRDDRLNLPPEVREIVQQWKRNGVRDLPLVSELLGQNKCWYIRRYMVPDAAGLPGEPLAPTLSDIMRTDPVAAGHVGIPHIALARLAKEGLLTEIITTNVDMLHETGCEAVGMKRLDGEKTGRSVLAFPWVEGYHTVTDGREHAQILPSRKLLTIHKIHGCLDATREAVLRQKEHKCSWNYATRECLSLQQKVHNFVFTYRELLSWRRDHWAHDLLADRARGHHIVFAGFALADPVTHALFRDVFEEVAEDAEQNDHAVLPLMGADSAPNQRPLRAQFIAKEKTVQASAVLLSANRSDPQKDPRQLALVVHRRDLEELFMGVYNHAVVKLLHDQLKVRGYALIERWVHRDDPTAKMALTAARYKDLKAFLSNMVEEAPAFLYHTLPGALRLSWLATDPVLGWGLPEQGEDSRNPYESRYASPHYYVPLSKTLDLTILLLQAYCVLLGGPEPDLRKVHFLPGGWVRFAATVERSALAILPVLSPMEANLPLISRLRAPAPPPRTPALLLEIRRSSEPKRDLATPLIPIPLGLASGRMLTSFSLDRAQLFSQDNWKEELESHIVKSLQGDV